MAGRHGDGARVPWAPGTQTAPCRAVVALVVAVTAGLAGCAGATDPSGRDTAGPGTHSSGAPVTGTVTVFAAASLTESFTQIGKNFEEIHPGASVTFNFAGSSALATQINQGAPADVFAAASPSTMDTVVMAGNGAGDPVTFTRNQLVIAVSRGNPRGITGLADLLTPGMKVALCAPQVPCGAAAEKALSTAGVSLTPATLEQNVKAALSKVTLGEVDAALVYRTDARAAASDVDGIEFPESASAINAYPIVVVKNAPNPGGARAFVSYVLSSAGQAVLVRAGFQAP